MPWIIRRMTISISVQAETIRLTPSRVHGDDHISQQLRVEGDKLSLPHGEGKNIGRFITAEISPVQFLNLAVVDKGDADFSIREGQVGQDRFSYFSLIFLSLKG